MEFCKFFVGFAVKHIPHGLRMKRLILWLFRKAQPLNYG
jgi:hypothetical protein